MSEFQPRAPTERIPKCRKKLSPQRKTLSSKKTPFLFLCKDLKEAAEQKTFWKKTPAEQPANPSKAAGKLGKDFVRRENWPNAPTNRGSTESTTRFECLDIPADRRPSSSAPSAIRRPQDEAGSFANEQTLPPTE